MVMRDVCHNHAFFPEGGTLSVERDMPALSLSPGRVAHLCPRHFLPAGHRDLPIFWQRRKPVQFQIIRNMIKYHDFKCNFPSFRRHPEGLELP